MLHAFPELTNGAIGVILERAKEKGFTDQRLTDAVNNVIDNCVYPRPKPADFLTFDKRVKVFSYAEACAEVGRSVGTLLEFTRILINGKGFFIRNSDKELYNIPNEM